MDRHGVLSKFTRGLGATAAGLAGLVAIANYARGGVLMPEEEGIQIGRFYLGGDDIFEPMNLELSPYTPENVKRFNTFGPMNLELSPYGKRDENREMPGRSIFEPMNLELGPYSQNRLYAGMGSGAVASTTLTFSDAFSLLWEGVKRTFSLPGIVLFEGK